MNNYRLSDQQVQCNQAMHVYTSSWYVYIASYYTRLKILDYRLAQYNRYIISLNLVELFVRSNVLSLASSCT